MTAISAIGIALIGTGFMGKSHALAWRNARAVFGDVPPVDLEVLCDANEAAVQALSDQWGFARASTDWRAAVADPRVQIVSITTPNRLHRTMVEAALAAGKHVWCEKPMALTLADAEAMAAAAAAAAGCRTQLGYNYTRNPALAHARRLIEADAIGTPFHFRGFVDSDYMADAELPWSWRCIATEAGLGTAGDIVTHLISMAHMLLGPIARVVAAELETVHRDRKAPDGTRRPVENDDMVQALVRFESGISGVLLGSRVAWGRQCHYGFEIHGSKGTLRFDQERLNELQLYVAEGDPATRGFRTILSGPAHPPYGAFVPAPGHQLGFNDLKVIEAAEFLRAIAGGPPVAFDFAAGLAIERVVHGIAAAARARREMSVA